MKSLCSAVPRHGPFRPADRQRQKKQRANVRNHERAAAMRRCLAGEPKKIAEAYCGAGDREDDADPRSPFHCFLAVLVHARFDSNTTARTVSMPHRTQLASLARDFLAARPVVRNRFRHARQWA